MRQRLVVGSGRQRMSSASGATGRLILSRSRRNSAGGLSADPRSDRRRVLVRVIVDREDVAAGRASMQAALDRLLKRYSNAELAVIADFLARNADRLRTGTEQLRC
jgi:hypothetical protein